MKEISKETRRKTQKNIPSIKLWNEFFLSSKKSPFEKEIAKFISFAIVIERSTNHFYWLSAKFVIRIKIYRFNIFSSFFVDCIKKKQLTGSSLLITLIDVKMLFLLPVGEHRWLCNIDRLFLLPDGKYGQVCSIDRLALLPDGKHRQVKVEFERKLKKLKRTDRILVFHFNRQEVSILNSS